MFLGGCKAYTLLCACFLCRPHVLNGMDDILRSSVVDLHASRWSSRDYFSSTEGDYGSWRRWEFDHVCCGTQCCCDCYLEPGERHFDGCHRCRVVHQGTYNELHLNESSHRSHRSISHSCSTLTLSTCVKGRIETSPCLVPKQPRHMLA